MSPRRDRPRKDPRRTPFLEARRRLLVVCEGAVTERQYFEEFVRWCRNPLVEVRIHSPAGVPFSLVTAARDLKHEAKRRAKAEDDDNLHYEDVWCVFDVDDHPRLEDARVMAADNGLRLAMSNPCFELWLLLHLRENPGAQHRHKLQDMLAKLTPGVADKHLDFDLLAAGYDDAFRRAERLERAALEDGEAGRNPTTEVFHLTDSIDPAGAVRRARPPRPDSGRAKATAAADAAFAQAEAERAVIEE